MYKFDPDYSEETENVNRVRDALKDYYGTAVANGFPTQMFLSRKDELSWK